MFALILCSVLAGICLTLLIELLLCYKWTSKLPVITPSWKPQTEPYVLPAQLQEAVSDIHDAEKKETCLGLNLVFQFLFQELKDTQKVRRWVMRRMQKEFSEMLQQSTTGKLLEQITVRDFNLGSTFPIVRNVTTNGIQVDDDSMIETVTLLLDLTYNGRFQLAIDVDMVFGRSAYLSVMMTKLQGIVRLQYTRVPYTHWSFAFTQDPLLEFEVESQLEGRPIPQLASIIVNQIRKSVRKKHTLPAYKIRYQPFFVTPTIAHGQAAVGPQPVYVEGQRLNVGQLRVTILNCSRLIQLSAVNASVYCTVSVDTLPWVQLMADRLKRWKMYDIEITRAVGLGTVFLETYLADKTEVAVVVMKTASGLSVDDCSLAKGDVLVAVNGVKVLNSKQAARLITKSPDRVFLRIERSPMRQPMPATSSQYSLQTDVTDDREDEETVSLASREEFTRDDVDDTTDVTISSQPIAAVQTECSSHAGSVVELSASDAGVIMSEKSTSSLSKMDDCAGLSTGADCQQSAALESGLPLSSACVDQLAAMSTSSGHSTKSDNSSSLVSTTNSVTFVKPASNSRRTEAVHSIQRLGSKVSSRSSTKMAAVTPLAKKGLTHLLNSSSALFHRKRQLKADSDTKSLSVGYSGSSVSLASVSNGQGEANALSDSSVSSVEAATDSQSVTAASSAQLIEDNIVSVVCDNDTFLMVKDEFCQKTVESYAVNKAEELPSCKDSSLSSKASSQPTELLNSVDKKDKTTTADTISLASRQGVDSKDQSSVDAGNRRPVDRLASMTVAGVEAKKTRQVRLCSSPAFNEKFEFEVSADQSYVNICVWCHLPQKLDKQQRVVKPPKDILIGHVSVDLMDVGINCLATLQSDFTEVFPLKSSNLKVDIGKPQFANLVMHPGFSEQLCYGDITLRFLYTWSEMSTKDRERILKQNDGLKSPTLLQEQQRLSSAMNTLQTQGVGKAHKFVIIRFQSSTYCNFCGKKIWFKSAYQCTECDMVCHKKCVEKCLLASSCSQNKSTTKLAASKLAVVPQPATIQPTPTHYVPKLEPVAGKDAERRRHMLASDESHSDSESSAVVASRDAETALLLPRPRSSTSLGDLVDSSAALSIEKLVSNVAASTASVAGDEQKLMQLCARAKKVQNTDEMVVTKAKKMGKELFAELNPEARKKMLDSIISKLQSEIDNESENRAELDRQTQAATEKKAKASMETKVEKSDEKLDSMTVLMLHYCAGLQHCLDQEEVERLKQQEEQSREAEDQQTMPDITLEQMEAELDSIDVVGHGADSSQAADELRTAFQLGEDDNVEMRMADNLMNMADELAETSSENGEEMFVNVTIMSNDEASSHVLETASLLIPETATDGDNAETNAASEVMCSAAQIVTVKETATDLSVETSGDAITATVCSNF